MRPPQNAFRDRVEACVLTCRTAPQRRPADLAFRTHSASARTSTGNTAPSIWPKASSIALSALDSGLPGQVRAPDGRSTASLYYISGPGQSLTSRRQPRSGTGGPLVLEGASEGPKRGRLSIVPFGSLWAQPG